jgi:hypothetical protein
MGNRAVLCLRNNDDEGFKENEVGIYLHWNGSPGTIEHFLKTARERMGSRIGDIVYAKARLIGVIHEYIDGNLSLGVGLVKELDYDNFDNGTYVINCSTLTVSGRKFNKHEVNDEGEITMKENTCTMKNK